MFVSSERLQTPKLKYSENIPFDPAVAKLTPDPTTQYTENRKKTVLAVIFMLLLLGLGRIGHMAIIKIV